MLKISGSFGQIFGIKYNLKHVNNIRCNEQIVEQYCSLYKKNIQNMFRNIKHISLKENSF